MFFVRYSRTHLMAQMFYQTRSGLLGPQIPMSDNQRSFSERPNKGLCERGTPHPMFVGRMRCQAPWFLLPPRRRDSGWSTNHRDSSFRSALLLRYAGHRIIPQAGYSLLIPTPPVACATLQRASLAVSTTNAWTFVPAKSFVVRLIVSSPSVMTTSSGR